VNSNLDTDKDVVKDNTPDNNLDNDPDTDNTQNNNPDGNKYEPSTLTQNFIYILKILSNAGLEI
jgi:hypothetical protein